MSGLALVLMLQLGCEGEEAPKAPAAVAEAPAPQPQEVKKETFSTGVRTWTPQTIGELQPVPPSRTVKMPTPIPSSPEIEATLETLKGVVRQYGGDPENPWAISHGLLAMGPDFVLTNGQPAVDWIFSEYGEALPIEGGPTLVRFPVKRGEQRIEPHTGLMLKNLTEIGVSPDKAVTVAGQPHTVADLYRGVLIGSYLDPAKNHSSFQSPNDVPWALQGLAAWAPPGKLQWVSIEGTPQSLDDLATFSASVLIAESQFMFETMKAGAELDKRGQGIFGYTCGGAHLLQGTAYAIARDRGTDLAEKGLLGQIPLLYWRLPAELKIYDRLMKQAPQHTTLLLVQRLKFVGHWLESVSKLAAMGFYQPSEEQRALIAGAANQVVLVVQGLQQQAVFEGLDELKKNDEQLYLDVVGDSAHAIRGLELALGRGTVSY